MDLTPAARRITRTLFAAQSLASAATVAIFPVVSIIGARLSGRPSWAGVPAMVYLLGQALSAFGWGQLMDRLGRRGTLVLGLLLGTAGANAAILAVQGDSFAGFLLGSLFIGFAVSGVQLARFIAAEVHPPAERGRAISTVVLGGTVGAISGPLLAGASARAAGATALDELSGPYFVTTGLFALAALVVFAWLRPEPREVGAAIAALHDPDHADNGPGRTVAEILRVPAAFVAVTAMVFGQLIMVMLMVITPLHMRGHEHPLSSISFVISVHVVGMYAFSIISGRLADRFGRGPIIVAGAGGLVLAGLTARLSPQVLPLAVALFLLGLGWNFSYVGGSSLLADQLTPAERGRTQGFNDLLIGLTSAAGSLGSGIVFAGIGYGAMALVAATVGLIPLTLGAWWQLRRAAPVAPWG
ncbi:MAG: MFS transporter [Armatimonadota bacterium]|nr:MFS transporter [Armatimonadota bacterium]MDR7451209.1 MFS transporter [Armatimonadota bacterium]MDR7467186.1 MFS transporter [Armatimonadota bacterium]MDR7495199.1 MFS transporter [Armatimonadota bacterium]MDR7500090.1 MFS transporter [Armatimonadota bacterium]